MTPHRRWDACGHHEVASDLRRIGAAALILAGLGSACAKTPPSTERPYAIPVDVVADTGRGMTLDVVEPPPPGTRPPRAAVWLARVSPVRSTALPVPEAETPPETLTVSPGPPPALAVDEGLKPPLPRSRVALAVPAGARGFIELDVRVDERGDVSEAVWAGGRDDPALVRAATECARRMEFYPALRAGRSVAVWCRQRFDFGGD